MMLFAAAEQSSPAGIVTAATAVAALLTSIAVLITVLVPMLRTLRTVHTIVNQQRTDAQRYQVALVEALRAHGIDVPIDQSLPVNGHPDADANSGSA